MSYVPKRHPLLTESKPEDIAFVSDIVDEENIQNWFEETKNYSVERDLCWILKDGRRIKEERRTT